MSDFQFVCPFCNTLLDCTGDLNGVETECPICNNTIVPVSDNNLYMDKNEPEEEVDIEAEKAEKSYKRLENLLNEQQQKIYPFIAKCPACKKVIELEKELKYSKQQCPFCNKTVILNTVKNQKITSIEKSSQETVNAKCSLCKNIISCPKDKIGMQLRCPGCGNWTKLEKYEKKVVNEKIYPFPKQQDYQDLSILSPIDKHDAFRCVKCENIVVISQNSESHIICPCCNKLIWLSEKNKVLEQKDESLTDFISAIKYEAGIKNKEVFFTNSVIQKKIKEQIKQKKKQDQISDTLMGCVAIIGCILILIGLGSCIASCDTSTEMSEEAKTYLMLKEAQDRLKEERKERAIKNLMDIMDRGY